MSTTNGGRNGGLFGTISNLGQALIVGLPPAFLLLVLMNVVFLSLVMWFLNGANEQRLQFANRLLDACITIEEHKR